MAKTVATYACTKCDFRTPKQLGICPNCKEFGSIQPIATSSVDAKSIVGVKSSGRTNISSPALRMKDIDTEAHQHKSTGIGELDRVLGGGLVAGGVILLAGSPGVGKALSLDTLIATPTGWSTIGQLHVGDEIFGEDGKPTKVVALSEVWENRPVYEVIFSDGAKILADENHEWAVSSRGQRAKAHRAGRELYTQIKTTKEISENLTVEGGKRLQYSVASPSALELEEAALSIPPYILGAWLGDGHSDGPNFTCFDLEITDYIDSIEGFSAACLPYGKNLFKLTVEKPEDFGVSSSSCGTCNTEYWDQGKQSNKGYCKKCQYNVHSFKGLLRGIGVLNNKHIPVSYLRASIAQRKELLAGLMDTDGFISKNGLAQFAVTSKGLAEGAFELIISLGYRANMTTKQVKGATEESSICYIINFSTTDDLCKLTRKNERIKAISRKTNGRRYIKEVNLVESVPVRCIEVDNESHLFLAGKEMIPTHNSSILAKVAHHLSMDKDVLYVSGEESIQQIKLRHRRMGAEGNNLYLASENDLSKVLWQIDEVKPKLIIVDSLQTIASPDIDGRAGSPSQVTEVATILTRIAKERGIPVIFVGHYTKAGDVAGPRVVEHLVDVVLSFEGEEDSTLRLLRGIKNRFGPADEIGCFEHTETGLEEVSDPSGLLLGAHTEPVSGVATSIFLEGKRALPIEIQALVTSTVLPNPRKVTSGLDSARTIMIQAVLQKHGGITLGDKDVYVSTIGGMRVKEPAVDLATVIALISAQMGEVSRNDAVAIGEVTLSGEIRKTTGIHRRLAEAVRLGFTTALVPIGTKASLPKSLVEANITLIELKDVRRAVSAVQGFAALNDVRNSSL